MYFPCPFRISRLGGAIVLLMVGTLLMPKSSLEAGPIPEPAHDRPYFMPDSKRRDILERIKDEKWARQEYRRIKKQVDSAYDLIGTPEFSRRVGREEGFWAAFLYALKGEERYLEVAKRWLFNAYGSEARFTKRAKKALDNPDYWTGSEKGVPWYRLDIKGYVAYDWIHSGLKKNDREKLHAFLRLQTEYRIACMDSWGSTPNLNFKPIFMVAFAGMALRDEHILDWGWQRQERQGNFYSMMDRMLKDQGIWHEATIYAVSHSGLWCVETMAFYRSLYEEKDWFHHRTPGGSSPKGMADYYIDTAYPLEQTGKGDGRIRVASYGDGATSPPVDSAEHDIFIGGLHPEPDSRVYRHLRDGLIMAYATSGNERYTPFIGLYPDYQPNLWDHPPLPDGPQYPQAPSSVWPEFGLAMLRSDESRDYFTNRQAIAAFQMMTKDYGHDQPDKFHLNLFGANRLLYPDYLRDQYEPRTIGWTYTSASQSTMLVDERDTKTATPNIRNDFTPEVKFLATSAEGVFRRIEQTRALMLTGQYLLDLFHASSLVPRTYDYLLHSMGRPTAIRPETFPKQRNVSGRYWALDHPRKTTTSDAWSIEFVLDEELPETSRPWLGPEWYDHVARCRVTMAAEQGTEVAHGTWGSGKWIDRAKKVYERYGDHEEGWVEERWGRPKVGMLIARREGVRDTVFAAAHEPYANDQKPLVQSVEKLAESDQAVVVRIEAEDFTDYAAVTWGNTNTNTNTNSNSETRHEMNAGAAGDFVFRGYGWLRIPSEGVAVGRGGWEGFRIPKAIDGVVLNGTRREVNREGDETKFGEIPGELAPTQPSPSELPFPIKVTPKEPRLSLPGEAAVTMRLTNSLEQPIEGRFELDLEEGLSALPKTQAIEPVEPGAVAELNFKLRAEGAQPGKTFAAFRVAYRSPSSSTLVKTGYERLPLILGRSMTPDYAHGLTRFDFEGAKMSARLESSGLVTYLEDAGGHVRLKGKPLFTVHDRKGLPHLAPEIPVVANLWPGVHTTIGSGHRRDGFRLRMSFRGDRIGSMRFHRPYTRQEAYIVTVPGQWNSPQGEPQWERIIAVDSQGNEDDATPKASARVAAAELGFPDDGRHIAFSFDPPRKIKFKGTGLKFVLPRPKPDEGPAEWSVGLCQPGKLERWRKSK